MTVLSFILLCLSFCSWDVHTHREIIDTVKAVVYGDEVEDIAVITLSDTVRPGIDGAIHSLDDRVFEKLLWFDGKKHRILPTESDIDRHLDAVKRENNIDEEQLIAIFRAGGFTYEEGKEQFGVMYTVNTMIDFKVRSGLFVSRADVQAYYDAHPEYVEAELLLKQGFVPFTYNTSKQEQKKSIQLAIEGQKEIKDVQWSPPFTIQEKALSADKQFLMNLEVGQISAPQVSHNGFELFQLVAKADRHLKSLDERYGEIAEMLRRPRYQEILTSYKMQLYDGASIVYF